jgi:hypothetical protein
MVWVPTANEDVCTMAVPVLSAVEVAITVAPSLNVTAPVGVPPVPLTVAVRVTCWP